MTEQDPAGQNLQRPIALTYAMDTVWIRLPQSFPFEQWQDLKAWSGYMTLFVYFRFMGEDPPPPSLAWAERTRSLIELGQQQFADGRNWDQFLIFHDLEHAPLPVDVDAFLGSLEWERTRELFSGATSPGIVEGPTVEPFEVEGAEVAQRSWFFQELDPAEQTVSANYVYTVRRDGYDIVVRALYVDLATMRDGVPAVDRFVRGIEVSYDAPSS